MPARGGRVFCDFSVNVGGVYDITTLLKVKIDLSMLEFGC